MTRQWWSVRQLAEEYGLCQRTFYRAIETGELVAYRLGGLRINNEDRIAWERRQQKIPKTIKTVAAGERQPHDPFWD